MKGDQTGFKGPAYDKYGRRREKTEEEREMEEYYQGEESGESEGEGPKGEGRFQWHEESSEEELDMDRVNELLGVRAEESGEDLWDEEEDVPLKETSTKRLALMNYDWTRIKAQDLFVAMSSFLPVEGILRSVTVYPSQFGLDRLKDEAVNGPGDIFKEVEETNAEEPAEAKARQVDQKGDTEWIAGCEDDGGLDVNKLRKYEKDRLKYYYAVVEFDSAKTADIVYEACNGYELEKTGIKIGSRA